MIKKIKNIDLISHSWGGVQIEPSAFYECGNASEEIKFANDNNFLNGIATGKAQFYYNNLLVSPLSEVVNILSGKEVVIFSPFASKVLTNGKKLYKRAHGMQQSVVAGDNVILYAIPYAWVKIIGLEVVNGESLDVIDLFILDSTTGTYSTIPNHPLNQFGFSVNVSAGYYQEKNEYDADLYVGMQLKIVYKSKSAKVVGVNFNLSEVK